MKEVRPSTWVLLGVLVLFIFGPLFLLDIEPIQELEPANNAPDIRPSNPRTTSIDKPVNRPANNTPAENGEGRLPDTNQPKERPLD